MKGVEKHVNRLARFTCKRKPTEPLIEDTAEDYRGYRLSRRRSGRFTFLAVAQDAKAIHLDYHDNPPSPGRDLERLRAWVDKHRT